MTAIGDDDDDNDGSYHLGGLLICDCINSVHPPKVEIISQKASYLTK